MDENEAFASFWGHIEELRRTLLRVLIIIISSVIACFLCYKPIISLLKAPLIFQQDSSSLHEGSLEYRHIYNPSSEAKTIDLQGKHLLSIDLSEKTRKISNDSYEIEAGGTLVYAKPITRTQDLVVMGPLEGILIALKISLWVGIFISSPIWLFILMQFFLPGLHQHERRLILPFLITSLIFVMIGCLFAFTITIPIANQYLITFNQAVGTNLWSLSNYLDYTLFLLMANGLAFELGAIGIFTVHLGFVSAQGLAANRRFAILGAFIIATILTPPDVLTQFMLAIPLIGLYEALILYAKFNPALKSQC